MLSCRCKFVNFIKLEKLGNHKDKLFESSNHPEAHLSSVSIHWPVHLNSIDFCTMSLLIHKFNLPFSLSFFLFDLLSKLSNAVIIIFLFNVLFYYYYNVKALLHISYLYTSQSFCNFK